MPRRRESPELTAAREQLRARYDEQQAAAAAFFDGAVRLAELREEVEGVEADLRRHAAGLVEALGVDTRGAVDRMVAGPARRGPARGPAVEIIWD